MSLIDSQSDFKYTIKELVLLTQIFFLQGINMRLIFSEVGSKYIAGMRLTYQQVLTY